MSALICMSCATSPEPSLEWVSKSSVYPDLTAKKFCRGKGYILSEGEMKGRLNFTFTASRDTAYIQFKDLIGRKALFLILKNEEIDAWDMKNNRRYDQASILISLPFFEMIYLRLLTLHQQLKSPVPNELQQQKLNEHTSLKNNALPECPKIFPPQQRPLSHQI